MTTDAAAIQDLLGSTALWRSIDVVPSTGSTNADLAAEAAAGEPEGRVRVALEQTAGRGRLARTWASPAEGSVSMSVLLQPSPVFPQWGWLSLMAGMAVRSAILELAGADSPVELKWPNDVLVRGRKVCGILSTRVEHTAGARAVVGLGINVAVPAAELPVPSATSLHAEGIDIDWRALVAEVLRHFEELYIVWQDGESLRRPYEAACASIGAELSIHVEPATRIHGRGHGVDDIGRILVATNQGTLAFAVGDVVHARLAGSGPDAASLG